MTLLETYGSVLPDLTRRLETALTERGLVVPARYVLHRSAHGDDWLFAVMDGQPLGKLENYISSNTLHQLQTYLEGRHVGISNSSGLRYCILLSPKKEIPTKVLFPGNDPQYMLLGEDRYGVVKRGWTRFGHWAIGGMTDWGKSNLLLLIALQCLGIGGRVAVLDMENRTFPQFKYAPQKYFFAENEKACGEGIDHLWEEYVTRKHLFDKLEPRYFPDNIFAYNALTSDPLPPLFVFIDEFVTLRTALAEEHLTRLESLTRLTRKYGIHFIFSSQTWNKGQTGVIRDQCHVRLALKTADHYQSIGIVGKPGAEQINLPGRVLSNHFGEFQSYFVEPHLLNAVLVPEKIEHVSKNMFSREEQFNQVVPDPRNNPQVVLEQPLEQPFSGAEQPLEQPAFTLEQLDSSAEQPGEQEKILTMLSWGASNNAIYGILGGNKQTRFKQINDLRAAFNLEKDGY